MVQYSQINNALNHYTLSIQSYQTQLQFQSKCTAKPLILLTSQITQSIHISVIKMEHLANDFQTDIALYELTMREC